MKNLYPVCSRSGFIRLMMLVTVYLTLFTFSAHAQETERCAASQIHQQLMATDPEYARRHEEIENATQQFVASYLQGHNSSGHSRGAVITIPVVFHIIHNGEPVGTGPNIADNVIISQMQVINEDFRRLNADAINTMQRFRGVAADCEIDFCLAQQDPQGNPTSGVNRINGGQALWAGEQIDAMIKPAQFWDPSRYLNIYTANVNNFMGTPILGFAYLPGINPVSLDGVVCDFRTIGRPPFNNNPPPFNGGRTLTHEIGHYLNLLHTFDNGCGNGAQCTLTGDNVCDTPPEANPSIGCPLQTISCGNIVMHQNYMNFVNDNCMNLFTAGQKARMQATLNNARTGLLNSTLCTPIFRATNITAVTATLSWSGILNAVAYNVRWRIVGGNGNWTIGFTNVPTINIAALVPSPNPAAFQFTTFEWQIQPIFADGTLGVFSAGQLFRTLGLAPAIVCPNDPNENAIFGPFLQPGTGAAGIICPANDRDRFVIMNNYMQGGLLRLILSNMNVVDYDLELRNANNNNLLASSTRTGTVNDTILYNNFPMGNYYVFVFAKVPGIVNVQPYQVNMQLLPPGMTFPPGARTMADMEASVSVYPNPAKDNVSISFGENEGTLKATLVDLSGKILQEVSDEITPGEKLSISTADIAEGLYFIKLKIGDETLTKKLMIAR